MKVGQTFLSAHIDGFLSVMSHKRRHYRHHSPLEGESQKQSRSLELAVPEPVEGSKGRRQLIRWGVLLNSAGRQVWNCTDGAKDIKITTWHLYPIMI